MITYEMSVDYELIAKHCPRCEALVMAQVVKTMKGEFYKYRNFKCSQCDWQSPGENSI
jgi:ssDNA-binding Zn-finger/Zn-ribbon topoisomerase 1